MPQASPSVRVLVVEDDPAIVSALSEYLAAEGFTVRSSATQDGACELLDNEQFDIALVDIGLAQGTGFAVCAAAKARPGGGVPVIFLTAANDEFTTVAGLDMGADDCFAPASSCRASAACCAAPAGSARCSSSATSVSMWAAASRPRRAASSTFRRSSTACSSPS